MDKAKAAVSNFLSKDGKHDTTVHETINPAITNEHVTRTHHENKTTAIDREVHQDHHHTSVQPITHREVLPEQHSHQMAGFEHRNIKHGNDSHVKERLAAEAAQFKDTRVVGDVQNSSSALPTIAGEHIHHHVYENIQPVIQKETVQPSVVHTTVPVHEIHQNEAKHHTATQLPAVSMSEFTKHGGSLSGREERTDGFQGEPKSVGGVLGGKGAYGSTSLTEGEERHGHHGTHDSETRESNYAPTSSERANVGTGTSGTGIGYNTKDHSSIPRSQNTTSASETMSGLNMTAKKPSLMDENNLKTDSSGEGKAGFMK